MPAVIVHARPRHNPVAHTRPHALLAPSRSCAVVPVLPISRAPSSHHRAGALSSCFHAAKPLFTMSVHRTRMPSLRGRTPLTLPAPAPAFVVPSSLHPLRAIAPTHPHNALLGCCITTPSSHPRALLTPTPPRWPRHLRAIVAPSRHCRAISPSLRHLTLVAPSRPRRALMPSRRHAIVVLLCWHALVAPSPVRPRRDVAPSCRHVLLAPALPLRPHTCTLHHALTLPSPVLLN
ncbi:hypothetical protein DENSPDRAFT_887016 [Dentipellis sp. KUC8613]|nr:hypothetical protein DENSPDRAFT_887016 [Dentipellis sp. KUC8613]